MITMDKDIKEEPQLVSMIGVFCLFILTLFLPRKCCLTNVSSVTNFKVVQWSSKLVKMLSERHTAWIRVRR